MNLTESKALLAGVQDFVVAHQVGEHLKRQRTCASCGQRHTSKDSGRAPVKTVFGQVEVSNPRWNGCACQSAGPRTFRPMRRWLKERTSPEMMYLETKWGSSITFAKVADLLCDVLPVDDSVNAETVRTHLQAVAERMEKELGKERQATCSKDRKRSGNNSLCRMDRSRWAWIAVMCGPRTNRDGSK